MCQQTQQPVGNLFSFIESLAHDMTPVVYQKGHVLFYEGHKPYGLFIIKEGRVELSSNENPSSMPGLQHVLDQSPYCCTCTAITEVRAVFLSNSAVQVARERTKN